MKLIILEGQDRTGKSSVCERLRQDYPKTKIVHWGYPLGDTNSEKSYYQYVSFTHEMKQFKKLSKENSLDLLIWDRSHIGEYVYGTTYRDSYPDIWIPKLEKTYLLEENVYLLFLHGDTDFLLQEDDGKSYTTQKETRNHEAALFHQAVDNSLIKNKLKIKVNNGNTYINRNNIYEQICNFISK